MKQETAPALLATQSGRLIDVLNPKPEDIDIKDIAHALSQLCRFGGHTSYFYSVAQHSVLTARALHREFGRNDYALWGLLHDAAEAYLVDIPRPLKAHMPQYQAIEERMLEAIAGRFGLGWPMPAIIKIYDDALLQHEINTLMRGPIREIRYSTIQIKEYITEWRSMLAEAHFHCAYTLYS